LAFVLVLTPVRLFADDKEWLSTEVLKQLQEIRRDLKSIKQDVQQLRNDIETIQAERSGNKKSRIAKVSLSDKPRMGEGEAKIAIIEFSDFECPFCRRHNSQTLPKLKETYIDTGKVQYVMRDYPLSFHRQAKSAAIAANCAGKQNNYWQMHDKLFSHKGGFKREAYISLAKELELDDGQYIRCLDDPAEAKLVDEDTTYGSSIGVRGTPAFFIGTIKGDQIVEVKHVQGAQPFSSFQRIIDGMLKEDPDKVAKN
jgi:protein-disulfide isomerase